MERSILRDENRRVTSRSDGIHYGAQEYSYWNQSNNDLWQHSVYPRARPSVTGYVSRLYAAQDVQ